MKMNKENKEMFREELKKIDKSNLIDYLIESSVFKGVEKEVLNELQG